MSSHFFSPSYSLSFSSLSLRTNRSITIHLSTDKLIFCFSTAFFLVFLFRRVKLHQQSSQSLARKHNRHKKCFALFTFLALITEWLTSMIRKNYSLHIFSFSYLFSLSFPLFLPLFPPSSCQVNHNQKPKKNLSLFLVLLSRNQSNTE